MYSLRLFLLRTSYVTMRTAHCAQELTAPFPSTQREYLVGGNPQWRGNTWLEGTLKGGRFFVEILPPAHQFAVAVAGLAREGVTRRKLELRARPSKDRIVRLQVA